MKTKFINFDIVECTTLDSKGLLNCGKYNISLYIILINLVLFTTLIQYKISWSISVIVLLFVSLITLILSFRSRSLLPITLYCANIILYSLNVVLLFSLIGKYYIIAYALIILVIFVFDNLILVSPLVSLSFMLTLMSGSKSYGIPILIYIVGITSGIIDILYKISCSLDEDDIFYTTKGEYTKKFIWTRVESLNLILSFSIIPVVLIYISCIFILKKDINYLILIPLVVLWVYSAYNKNKIKRIFKKG